MQFAFLTKRIHENLKNVLDNIEDLRKLMKQDGVQEKDLIHSLDKISGNIQKEIGPLTGFLEENKSKIEILEFLNIALNMEYAGIFDYKAYLDSIDNENVQHLLRNLSEEETKHAAALSKMIREMGGKATLESYKTDYKEEISLNEILLAHKNREIESIHYYEKGLAAFNLPEIQWLIGNIKTDEEKHLKKLDSILTQLEGKNIIIRRKKEGWIDPYMGEKGDRPWIEG